MAEKSARSKEVEESEFTVEKAKEQLVERGKKRGFSLMMPFPKNSAILI